MTDTSQSVARTSKEIDVIRAWIQTQWERVPVTPQSQPGSYARGYDGGMMDILRGLQKTLDKLPPAHETREGCKPTVESAAHRSAGPGCRCADCSIDGEACPTCYAAWWRDRHPTVHEHAQKALEQQPLTTVCQWEPIEEGSRCFNTCKPGEEFNLDDGCEPYPFCHWCGRPVVIP